MSDQKNSQESLRFSVRFAPETERTLARVIESDDVESPSSSPEVLVRRAITLVEHGEADKAAGLLNDHIPENRWRTRYLNHRLLNRRTRFFTEFAVQCGVRLSALLFLVAWNTRTRHEQGMRGRKAGWHMSAEHFGQQIGVDRKQVFRLVKEAEWHGLIGYQRTGRGLLIWITAKKIHAELKRMAKEDYVVGYYYLRLASLLGLNGSIIFGLVREYGQRGEGRSLDANGVVLRMPWMSKNAARFDLDRLYQMGAIQRERDGFHFSGGRVGWRYFWKKRSTEDRRKWKLFTKILP